MKKNILITAPAHYAHRLQAAFQHYQESVNVIHIPMVQSMFNEKSAEVTNFYAHINSYDYVICLSRKAIEAVHHSLKDRCHAVTAQFLAIGKDNEALRNLLCVEPTFISKEPSPMGIATELHHRGIPPHHHVAVLSPAFIDLDEPQTVPLFLEKLQQQGINAQRINVYSNMATAIDARKQAYDAIIDGKVSHIAFTSGCEVMAFNSGLKEIYGTDAAYILQNVCVACMGPYTASQATVIGLKVDMIPKDFNSFNDFVDAIMKNNNKIEPA